MNQQIDTYYILRAALYLNSSDKIEILLENFIQRAEMRQDYSFDNGILGAGWLISLLAYLEVLQVDIDDLLFDFDDNIYKTAVQTIVDKNAKNDDILNLLCYYQQRVVNRSNTFNFYRKFPQNEILKLLLEKLKTNMTVNGSPSLILSKALLKLSFLSVTCINEKEIEPIFYSKMESSINFFKVKNKVLTTTDVESLMFLLLAAKQFDHPHWVKNIETILSIHTAHHTISSPLWEIAQKYENDCALDSLDNYMNTLYDKDFCFLISNLKFEKIATNKYTPI